MGGFSQKAQVGHVKEFSLYGTFQFTVFKVGKLGGGFHLPARHSYFQLNYIARHSRGHLMGFFHSLNPISVIPINLGSKVFIGSFV